MSDGNPNTLGEIYAYGVRNPQRFALGPAERQMFLADIGQNMVEEVSLVTRRREPGVERLGGQLPYWAAAASASTTRAATPS